MAQQVQWQKGEQLSCCGLSEWFAVEVITVVASGPHATGCISAHGNTFSARTRNANIKAAIFTGAEGNAF